MRRAEFVRYLTTEFRGQKGNLLSSPAASDVASRARRVESAFDIDLDSVRSAADLQRVLTAIESGDPRLPIKGNVASGARDIQSAVRRYYSFTSTERVTEAASSGEP